MGIPDEQTAVSFLQDQLGSRAPERVERVGAFEESPLEGEGPVGVFAFELAVGPGARPSERAPHYAVVGETTPTYFPAYGMDANDAYSFHLGTRFMLVMAIQKVPDDREPPTARPRLEQVLAELATDAKTGPAELAAVFACDEAFYAIYKMDIDGAPYYVFGADCPPGFYPLTQFPPQMALRLHLGKLIRAEARAEREH